MKTFLKINCAIVAKTTTLFTFFFVMLASAGTMSASVTIDGIVYYLIDAALNAEVQHGDNYSGNIVIPENITYETKIYKVTSIGNSAFSGCTGLTSVTIPNSVTSIGNYAFYGCSGLTSIEIPNSVTSIEEQTFYGCSGLTSIEIPNSVKSIGKRAFRGCSSMTSVTIPNSVTSIGEEAFYGCSSLTSIEIPNSVKSIGNYAFQSCKGLTSVIIGNSVTSIGEQAFFGCTGLTSVTIPNSVTSIGKNAFYNVLHITYNGTATGSKWGAKYMNCYVENFVVYKDNSKTEIIVCSSSVTGKVIVPNSVTSIPENAFKNCSGLTSIEIPNSVTSIGSSAFYGCSGLTSIEIPNSVTSIEEQTFYGCSGLTSIEIPNSVKSIGKRAFRGCSSMTSVTIPNSVTSIGEEAFYGCNGLTSVTIPNSVTSISSSAFYGCSGLASIEIPDSVKSIGSSAFYGCSGLTSIEIPNSVKSIGSSAFYGCSGLTSIEIPNSVTSIGNNAFRNCGNLTSVALHLNAALMTTYYSSSKIINLFGNQVEKYHISIGTDVESLADNFFKDLSSLISITIPYSMKSIGNDAFSGCSNLTTVIWNAKNCNGYNFGNQVESFTFGDEVEVIPANLCSGMNKVTSIIIPSSVTNIEEKAFSGCIGITSIEIPNRVTSIGNSAFSGCTGLTSVTIPSSVTSISSNAFSGCSNLATVTINSSSIVESNYNEGNNICTRFGSQVAKYIIGEDITSVGNKAFAGSTNLTSVEFPDNLNNIGYQSFANCTSLMEITVPVNVKTIGESAFRNCSINKLYFGGNLDQWCKKGWSAGGISGSYTLYIGGEEISHVIIPNDIDHIGDGAFAGCINLTSVVIPNNITSIGDNAFGGCIGLTSVEIPERVTNIGSGAFSGCTGLTSIEIPNSVTSIGGYAFYGCTGLTSIIIPNNVTSIGGYAFYGCSGLTSVTINSNPIMSKAYTFSSNIKNIFGAQVSEYIIGNSVTSIGDYVFFGCTGLTSIEIPNSVTSIGYAAFYGCTGLTSIEIPISVTNIGKEAFSGCSALTSVIWNAKNCNGYNFGSQVNSFIFGSEVEVIPASICSGMTQLTSMTIPNSVTSIGDNAFSGCTGLTEIVIPINITNIGNSVFSGCNSITSVYWNAKNSNGYNFGSQVNSFIFGNEVEIIPASICSGMTQLTSMTIPNSVTSIGDNAFSGCARLTAVTIPSNVAHIGDNAFAGCPRLSSMIVENGNTEYDSRDNCNAIILSASNTLIFGCKNTKFPSSVTSIGKYAFNGCSSLKSVIIPNHVTNVGEYAFNDCSGMTSATVSSNMKTISSHMFNNCARLSSVIMNGNVTNIEEGAFAGCTSLTSITIPDNVTNVGMYAFDGCSGLTSAITSNNMTVIKSSTFRNCSRLASVTIGRNVTDVESGAFYGCPLTSVTLLSNAIVSRNYTPESNISNIFGSQIKEYILGTGINRLGNNAFYGCSGVQSITILRTTPPSGYSSALDNICYAVAGGKFAPIYVPCGCLEAYELSWFSRYFVRYAPYKYKIKGLVNSENMGRVLVADDVCGGISAEAYEGYHFVQWSDGETDNPRYVELTQDTTFKAIFAINEYVITWLNEDSSLIDQKTVVHGVVPTHSEPIKPATAEYTYTFAGWTPAVVAATSDATYRAQFKATKNIYTITWQNEDGSLIDQTTVEYGVIPTHADPVKQNTAEYTYTFAGWTPAVVAVTGNATYRATFNVTKNSYTITWQNEDGSLIDQTTVEYGVVPTHADPVKPNTAEYTYTFAGWTPAVVAVTGNATYRATFNATKNIYAITVYAVNGSVDGAGKYAYGTVVTLTAIPDENYEFEQWLDGVTDNPRTITVTGNAEYTALFKEISHEGIDDVNCAEPIHKVLINGHIYILRADHIFDTQ